jgi:hypothetical protein
MNPIVRQKMNEAFITASISASIALNGKNDVYKINWKRFLTKRLWPISGFILSQDRRCLGRHSSQSYLETLREIVLLVTLRRNPENEDLKQLLH